MTGIILRCGGVARLMRCGLYATLAHQVEHVEAYLAAADAIFPELAEAIEKGDAKRRIGGPVHHTGFRRLA